MVYFHSINILINKEYYKFDALTEKFIISQSKLISFANLAEDCVLKNATWITAGIVTR